MTIAAGNHRVSSPPPSTLLAPGFRFHPTDEELVSYYLKRKVSGRPLRVDPISEVDLYKYEPWDLPIQSRIRSRDMEWYFFSPLDRKYANRLRTNRATSQGYWKTTGKDRQVRHGGHTVGMKKTLVFHVGRAPRGQRTNWVMHEYRLEGEDLPSSSIPQDSYVVCRIFQKSGPGPQNGAQYGAPFVEEDWEEDVKGYDHVAVQGGSNNALAEAAGNQDYFPLTDILENDENNGNQLEEKEQLAVDTSEHSTLAKSVDNSSFLEDLIDQNLCNNVDEYITVPEVHDEMPIPVEGDDGCSPGSCDGFVELNDLLIRNESENYLCNEEHIDNISGAVGDEVDLLANSSLNEINADVFFDILNEVAEQPEALQSNIMDDLSLQRSDVPNRMPAEYPIHQSHSGNLALYETPGQEYPHNQEYFAQSNDFLASMDDSSGVDMVDELMAFFDATDDKLHYEPSSYLENNKELDSYLVEPPKFEQVEDQSLTGPMVSSQTTHEGVEMGASSSGVLSADDRMPVQNEHLSDTKMGKGLEKNFTKRLVNMLGSISSPPALAAEFPSKSAKSCVQSSATHAGGSIHVTAGMIHLRSLTFADGGDWWSIQKNGSLEFFFSYGVGGGGIKAIGFEPKMNLYADGPAVLLRGWFYVLFISALFLAATYRIGVSICTR